jgi:hypothetical protein
MRESTFSRCRVDLSASGMRSGPGSTRLTCGRAGELERRGDAEHAGPDHEDMHVSS